MRKYFIIGLLAITLVLPAGTNAQTTAAATEDVMASLRQQMANLLRQIDKMQEELGKLRGEVVKVEEQIEKLTKRLYIGSSDNEVKILQEFLRQDPEIYPEGLVTGYYGPLTEKAVKKFQEKNGIESVGIVGPKTLARINEVIEEKKITICHIAPDNPEKKQTITISKSALEEHMAHGDKTGVCEQLVQPATPSSSAPLYSINIISPNGGETWTTGSSQFIKWWSNIPITYKIMIVRLRDFLGVEHNLLTDTINDGIEKIIVPINLVAGFYTLEMKTIVDNQTFFDKSNAPFSIMSSATSSPILTPAPADITPPIISNIQVTQGGGSDVSTCATVTWDTNEASNSKLIYANHPLASQTNFMASGYDNYNVIHHKLSACDMSFGSLYYFKVYSTDASGNTAESKEQTFTTLSASSAQTQTPTSIPTSSPAPTSTPVPVPTPSDIIPPAISNVSVNNISSSSATITWTTNESATTYIQWGLTSAYGFADSSLSSLVTSHSVVLSGLQSNTIYHYKVISKDAAGNSAGSNDYTFTTVSSSDISIKKPDLIITNLTWSSSIEPNKSFVASITVKNIGEGTKPYASIVYSINTPLTTPRCIHGGFWSALAPQESITQSFTLGFCPELEKTNYGFPQGTYEINAIIDYDNVINESNEANNTFTKTLVVGNLAATTSSTCTDSDGGKDYYVKGSVTSTASWDIINGSGTQWDVCQGTQYIDEYHCYYNDLMKRTEIRHDVLPCPNNGTCQNGACVSTPVDTAPPVISGIEVRDITSSAAKIEWKTNELATSQVIYGTTDIYHTGNELKTILDASLVLSHSVPLANLQENTLYHYRIESKDAVGNLAVSGSASFTAAAVQSSAVATTVSCVRETTKDGVTCGNYFYNDYCENLSNGTGYAAIRKCNAATGTNCSILVNVDRTFCSNGCIGYGVCVIPSTSTSTSTSILSQVNQMANVLDALKSTLNEFLKIFR